MKRFIPLLSLLIAVFWLAADWRPESKSPDGFDTVTFGRLPVLSGGRLKPLDTVARNSLLIISGRQTHRTPDGKRMGATRWLVDALFDAPAADANPVFLINNPEVLSLLDRQQDDRKRFAFDELRPFLDTIEDEGGKASELEGVQRSPYQTAVLNLQNALFLYLQLRDSMQPASEGTGTLRPVPPLNDAARLNGEWATIRVGGGDAVSASYQRLGNAARAFDPDSFNRELTALSSLLGRDEPAAMNRVGFERLFNHLAPFYTSMGLYVLAGLLACASWLFLGAAPELRRSAVWVLLIALLIHTFGLVARMYLQGRPPVTNLYSSAVFIGWGTVILGLILERIYKDGIGAVCASTVGFVTLIIAHHLAGSGDTLQMLQAVLDTNIWLATHVVVITAGYSAMFLAGTLAIIYVIRGSFGSSLDKATATALERMVYGVICFATLFSFVGTVLGGIWADQSWGRFWGWDPKENGALLIVLWCAIILHARWGGFIRGRGLMIMALFGNVITSFSWFGVNMLGVGLHSYGFMSKAFPWLIGFVISQVLLMALAALPQARRKNSNA